MQPRTRTSSLAASPTLVGAVTVLVAVVAVFLSYNANQGLPFVPVYRVAVEIPNASRLIESNEVRIGGHRVGVIEAISPVSTEGDKAVARVALKLDRAAQPIPQDSIFRVRYLSTFGLKYLEIIRGTGPAAPEGFVFDGGDDAGRPCELPVQLAGFSDRIPATARNGCFQPQEDFDDLGSGVDARSREDLRAVLTELGGGVAGRGPSVGAAIEVAPPLLEDLAPVARTLAADSTRLDRFVRALERTASAVAPVSTELAQGFANAAVAFEAISRDPAAVQASISEAAPLLTDGVARLARARALLADTAELARRLEPGVRDLGPTLPVLNDAIEVGTPVLDRVPGTGRKLRAALVALRRLVDQPSTGVVLERLRDTFDQALPLAAHVAPAQTVCNYWNYTWTFLGEHLSMRSSTGYSQRNIITQQEGMSPGPLSIGGTLVNFPKQAKAPLAAYSGLPADGLAGEFSPHPGMFEPRELPIGHAPINAPHGQLTDEYPDCATGQLGYPLGELLLPNQPYFAPGIAVGDYPGSLGPTTAYFRPDGSRVLRDTRVEARAPTTWGLGR
ncbi:MAG TPA: MlaD family protein [Solirubrobacterales bacterium]